MLPGMSGETTVADRTWSPEVVEAMARVAEPQWWSWWDAGLLHEPMAGTHRALLLSRATTALSASPLPDALDLIERMEKALKSYERYYEAGGNNIGFEAVAHSLAADAAAFVARVREG